MDKINSSNNKNILINVILSLVYIIRKISQQAELMPYVDKPNIRLAIHLF